MSYFAKKIFISIASCVLYHQAYADSVDIPVLVPTSIDQVFVPNGFDDNDDVEVILSGKYNSSCYRNGPTTFNVDSAENRITIKSEAYFHIGAPCKKMTLPFLKKIKLGFLKAGTYSIFVEGNPQLDNGILNIKNAEYGVQDDFMYAPVESVSIKEQQNHSEFLILNGHYPKVSMGCLTMKSVRFEYAKNMLIVLPVMSFQDGSACGGTYETAYSIQTALPTPVKKGSLIYVRTANGESFNTIYQ